MRVKKGDETLNKSETLILFFSLANQERLKPQEEKIEEDRSKVDDLRGSPMSVGNLEVLIDENNVIVSSSVGLEYYIEIFVFC
ncbi:hypothetical protein Lal_00023234 [Lupinus albus]|nr:hypothetical protein Lal_00023234 [Lupinus albus]